MTQQYINIKSWVVPSCPSAISVSLAVSNNTPSTTETITLTATALGFTPTNYVFYALQGSNLYLLGQNSTGVLSWTVNLNGSFTVFVNADDTLVGSFNVGGNSVTSSIIIQTGLQLHLDPSLSVISGTNYPDLSPFSRNGTLINSPTVDTNFNGGNVLFNGVNQRVGSIGAVADFSFIQNTAVFTVMGFFNPADVSLRSFAISAGSGSSTKGFALVAPETSSFPVSNTRSVQFWLTRGDSGVFYYVYSASNLIPASGWVHIAVTMNGLGTGQIYKNGVAVTTFNTNLGGFTLSTGNSSSSINVGSFGTVNFYNGRIAPVQIYNAPLSAADVLYNFNLDRLRYGL
jgi:hypothetical protein